MITWGLYIFGRRDTDFYTNIWIKLRVILIPCTRQVTIKVSFPQLWVGFLGFGKISYCRSVFFLPPFPSSLFPSLLCSRPSTGLRVHKPGPAAGTQDCLSLSSSSKSSAGGAGARAVGCVWTSFDPRLWQQGGAPGSSSELCCETGLQWDVNI